MTTTKSLVLLLAVVLLIAVAPSANSIPILGNDVSGIVGKALALCTPTGGNPTGLPVANVTVVLTISGIPIAQGITDANGRVVLVANLSVLGINLLQPLSNLVAIVQLPVTSLACPVLQTATGILRAPVTLTSAVTEVNGLLLTVATIGDFLIVPVLG
ncbi:OLC1v1009113C1 [Oldenlandia corymbosa var. corymbosa]|uniref:OLC1v1009113C1 n=1 Tax=Oldenlandia corymbosa var. corymbosa TaxID=529605 RepID=A0AAV1DN37_OLDCO|nr:OLC1v1009113C1 [Oldenlandia corymbosa var. corymbosa]